MTIEIDQTDNINDDQSQPVKALITSKQLGRAVSQGQLDVNNKVSFQTVHESFRPPSEAKNHRDNTNSRLKRSKTIPSFHDYIKQSQLKNTDDNTTRKKTITGVVINHLNKVFSSKSKSPSLESLLLADLPKSPGSLCPQIINDCIKRLIEIKGHEKQGIGRISGSNQNVKMMVDLHLKGNHEVILSSEKPHEIISVLKHTLVNAKDRVIPDSSKEWFLEPNPNDNNINAYKDFISKLPGMSKEILKRLIFFFSLVASDKKRTLMDSHNCAICISQNLVDISVPKNVSEKELKRLSPKLTSQAAIANERVEFMINNYTQLFVPPLYSYH